MGYHTTRKNPNAYAQRAERIIAAARSANRESAEDLKEDFIRECPKSKNAPPGHTHLWQTVDIEHVDENTINVNVGDSNHKYWAQIEFGSVYRPADAFMTRSFQMLLRRRRDRIRQAIREAA